MTTPMTEGRPTDGGDGASPPDDRFVVRADHRQVRRDVIITAVCLVLVVLMVVREGLDGSWGWTAFQIAAGVVVLASTVWQVRLWRRLLAIDVLAEVGPAGIRVATTDDGLVALPWEAIGSVRRDLWDRLAIRPAAGFERSTPGGRWPRGLVGRWSRSRYVVPMRFTAWDVTQVQAAVRHFSHSRF